MNPLKLQVKRRRPIIQKEEPFINTRPLKKIRQENDSYRFPPLQYLPENPLAAPFDMPLNNDTSMTGEVSYHTSDGYQAILQGDGVSMLAFEPTGELRFRIRSTSFYNHSVLCPVVLRSFPLPEAKRLDVSINKARQQSDPINIESALLSFPPIALTPSHLLCDLKRRRFWGFSKSINTASSVYVLHPVGVPTYKKKIDVGNLLNTYNYISIHFNDKGVASFSFPFAPSLPLDVCYALDLSFTPDSSLSFCFFPSSKDSIVADASSPTLLSYAQYANFSPHPSFTLQGPTPPSPPLFDSNPVSFHYKDFDYHVLHYLLNTTYRREAPLLSSTYHAQVSSSLKF